MQAWQAAVYPLLQSKASTAQQGLSLYLVLYYGAAISNFLEVRPAPCHPVCQLSVQPCQPGQFSRIRGSCQRTL